MRRQVHNKRIIKKKKSKKLFSPPTSKVVRIKYDCSYAQHIGKREQQQDCIGVLEGINGNIKADFIAVLCDGMGGLKYGKEISNTALSLALKHLPNVENNISASMEKIITLINKNVVDFAINNNIVGQTGTTMLMVILKDGWLYWCSVGDSRIYFKRDNRLMQINHEHNYTLELLETMPDGDNNRQAVFANVDGHKLISYIGQPELNRIEVSKTPFPIRATDQIILASDGLFNTMTDNEILKVLDDSKVDMTAKTLVKKTLRKNSSHQDNVSVIVINYRGADSEF